MNDDIENQLAKVIAGKSHDLDWAKEQYEDELESLKQRTNGDVSDDKLDALKTHAVRLVKSAANEGARVGGEVQKVDVVAIGHAGVQKWSDGDGGKKDVLLAYGVVKPQDKPMGLGVFINDETTGVDIGNVRGKFETLNELEAYYSVGESDDLANTYILNSEEETRIDVKDESEMADEDARRNLLHQHTDEAKLESVKDYLSAMDSEGRTVAFGGDVKRMNATVVDAVSLDNASIYTVLDDSVIDPEELDDDVRDDRAQTNASIYTVLDDSVIDPEELDDDVRDDRAQTPGMTAWCPEDFMRYGTNSQVEVYGSITTMDDGQVCMNICGIVPLITFEMEDDSGSGGGNVDVSDI